MDFRNLAHFDSIHKKASVRCSFGRDVTTLLALVLEQIVNDPRSAKLCDDGKRNKMVSTLACPPKIGASVHIETLMMLTKSARRDDTMLPSHTDAFLRNLLALHAATAPAQHIDIGKLSTTLACDSAFSKACADALSAPLVKPRMLIHRGSKAKRSSLSTRSLPTELAERVLYALFGDCPNLDVTIMAWRKSFYVVDLDRRVSMIATFASLFVVLRGRCDADPLHVAFRASFQALLIHVNATKSSIMYTRVVLDADQAPGLLDRKLSPSIAEAMRRYMRVPEVPFADGVAVLRRALVTPILNKNIVTCDQFEALSRAAPSAIALKSDGNWPVQGANANAFFEPKSSLLFLRILFTMSAVPLKSLTLPSEMTYIAMVDSWTHGLLPPSYIHRRGSLCDLGRTTRKLPACLTNHKPASLRQLIDNLFIELAAAKQVKTLLFRLNEGDYARSISFRGDSPDAWSIERSVALCLYKLFEVITSVNKIEFVVDTPAFACWSFDAVKEIFEDENKFTVSTHRDFLDKPMQRLSVRRLT